jgi:hypothetical protein
LGVTADQWGRRIFNAILIDGYMSEESITQLVKIDASPREPNLCSLGADKQAEAVSVIHPPSRQERLLFAHWGPCTAPSSHGSMGFDPRDQTAKTARTEEPFALVISNM